MISTTSFLDVHQQQQLHYQQTSTCDRHPDVPVTGFCASCLRERLAGLETTTTGHLKPPTTTTTRPSIKSIFSRTTNNNTNNILPGLRRCKSFSGGGPLGPLTASSFEPQRRSCDVRGRNTLWSLFHLEQDPTFPLSIPSHSIPQQTQIPQTQEIHEEEEDEDEDEDEEEEEEEEIFQDVAMNPQEEEEEITQVEEEKKVVFQEEEERVVESDSNKKVQSKDLKEIAGSFWLAASVFSRKLQNWRRKQKLKKQNQTHQSASSTRPSKPSPRPLRGGLFDSQSELVSRRRSCDVDPGRVSFDDPRFSFDDPRASWDGHLIGARSVFSRPMLAVVEDLPAPAPVQRFDGLIPVEDDVGPGGMALTREYYSDSRRRSLDRSGSVKRPAVVEVEEPPRFSSTSLQCESFEFRDPPPKKSRRWRAWSIWGLIHRRRNGVERSMSETWPEMGRRQGLNGGNVYRSNSSLSSRSGRFDPNWRAGGKRDIFPVVFERNPSVSRELDSNNAMRFYGTENGRRIPTRERLRGSNSFRSSMLHLY